VVPAHTHSLTSPRSRNGGTTHDETGVEAEGRSRRVEIPPQSQRRDGTNVATGVETGVCSKKTRALRCRDSRSRGVRDWETRNRSLFFGGVDVRASTTDEGDTTKEHQQGDLLAFSIVRTSRSPAKEADDSARVCASHGVRARDRIDGVTTIQPGRPRQRRIQPERHDPVKGTAERAGKVTATVNPTRKAAITMDPTKAIKWWAVGRVQPGRGLRRIWQDGLTTATGGA
jgi:hypothetical protein